MLAIIGELLEKSGPLIIFNKSCKVNYLNANNQIYIKLNLGYQIMNDIKNKLTQEQYRITQEHGTEPAFSGAYWDKKDPGNYFCVCCNTKIFSSNTKYNSGSGWPAFFQPVSDDVVGLSKDNSLFMERTEAHCFKCKSLNSFQLLLILRAVLSIIAISFSK